MRPLLKGRGPTYVGEGIPHPDKSQFIAQILGDIVGQGLAPAVKVCAIFCGTSKPVPYVKTLYLWIF